MIYASSDLDNALQKNNINYEESKEKTVTFKVTRHQQKQQI
jgi:hypothetical protein